MNKTIFVLNGPNLNMLGRREPDIYGSLTLDEIEKDCRELAGDLGVEIDFRQTNHEGILVDWLQEAVEKADAVVLNPGAYGHQSIAMHDAIRAGGLKLVEIHLSNIHAREDFRSHSMIAPVASGMICGFGAQSYRLGLQAAANLARQ